MRNCYYIGIDLGTTAIKVGFFDLNGNQLQLTSKDFSINNTCVDHVEFDIDNYINAALSEVKSILKISDVSSNDVRGIGVCSQAQTFVLLDADNRPLMPAISWLDKRAQNHLSEFNDIARESSGLVSDYIASGPKILWLKQNEPDILKNTKKLTLLPDYLILKLTGNFVSDVRTAESTGMFDRKEMAWDNAVLNFCGLQRKMVPSVGYPGDFAGKLKSAIAKELGLESETIVAIGAMDQLAGAIGVGNVKPGIVSISLGTALASITSSTQEPPLTSGICVRPHPVKGLSALLTYTKAGGIFLRWFRNTFVPEMTYDEIFATADSVPVGADCLTCLPHIEGTASPSFNPLVRGTFFGISKNHNMSHFARAVVEGLSFSVCENIESFREIIPEITCLRAIGGGAKSDVWLQMIADCTQIKVERPVITEAACFGAAQLAMIADKKFNSIKDSSNHFYHSEKVFIPNIDLRDSYNKAFKQYRVLFDLLYKTR